MHTRATGRETLLRSLAMRRPAFVPSTSAWLSALSLFAFERAWFMGAIAIAPYIFELWDTSPRLGALAFLALLVSPIPLIALGYRALSGMLDHYDARAEARRGGASPSLWAGFCGWGTARLAGLVASLVTLAVFPPPPHDDEMLSAAVRLMTHPHLELSVYTGTWIVVSALVYSLARRARRSDP